MIRCIQNVYNFYIEGFRNMKEGKVLWLIILVKLFIMFFILKIFFFSDFLGKHETDSQKEDYVSKELINRANSFTN